jgi:nucleoid-associated protein YgaU
LQLCKYITIFLRRTKVSKAESQALVDKWKPILEHADMPEIKDPHRRAVVARLLENQKLDMSRGSEILVEDAAPSNVTANVGKYDPVLISLVRRSMPNLIAYDVCGVQPMTGPTGLVFAMRPKYITGGALGAEAFYNEADSDFSGAGTQTGTNPSVLNDAVPGAYTRGTGMATAAAEALGVPGGTPWAEMGFEIEKYAVEATSRKLKATYSLELAQDLKAVHGLDAESELTNILSSEILAEINREVIRSIYITAKPGAQSGTVTAGTFDLNTDSDGRWSAEKFKGLFYRLDKEANQIAKETRRGKGNFIICSSDVATAFSIAGMLDYAPALATDLQVDDTGNTFAGVLNGKYRVFIDPYATGNFFVVGYKGASALDAGVFYSPYVPLQLYKATSDDSFTPKIGFQTRYSLSANPFAQGLTKGSGLLNANTNVYYRRTKVVGI